MSKERTKVEVKYIHHCGDDLTAVNAARVSYDRQSDWEIVNGKKTLKKGDVGLLSFLARGMRTQDYEEFKERVIRHSQNVDFLKSVDLNTEQVKTIMADIWKFRDQPEHHSPFNHAFMSFQIIAPITVARQCVKHAFMPYNEVSGRYIQFKEEDINIPSQFREKIADKKQGSGDFIVDERFGKLQAVFLDNAKDTYANYRKAIDEYNLTEEQARELLPLGLHTRWQWSGTTGAFFSMLKLRLASDAQYETRKVAEEIAKHVKEHFPISYQFMVERKFD